jgi:hypothetical protein
MAMPILLFPPFETPGKPTRNGCGRLDFQPLIGYGKNAGEILDSLPIFVKHPIAPQHRPMAAERSLSLAERDRKRE